MENLWPDFGDFVAKMPNEILNEQANFLIEKTKGVIYAEVLRIDFEGIYITDDYDDIKGTFGFRFVIRSKYMEHYKFELFKIFHDFDLYPVTFLLDEKMSEELGKKKAITLIHSEQEYLNFLKKLFNTKRLFNVISVMRKITDFS